MLPFIWLLRADAAVSALLLVIGLASWVDVVIPAKDLTLVFLVTWLVYLLDAEAFVSPEDGVGSPSRYRFFRQHARRIAWLRWILTATCAAICLTDLSILWRVKYQAALVAICSAIYVSPAIPLLASAPKLKRVTPWKSVVIPIVWLLGALTFVRAYGPPLRELWALAAPCLPILFAFLLLDTLVLDWLDREADRVGGTRSFPLDFPKASGWLAGFCCGVLLTQSARLAGWRGFLALGVSGLTLLLPLRFPNRVARGWVGALRMLWFAVFWWLG